MGRGDSVLTCFCCTTRNNCQKRDVIPIFRERASSCLSLPPGNEHWEQLQSQKLKSKVNTSDNGSLTLRKLEELQDALKVNSNQPEKVNEMNESLKECKTKLNLQKQINVTLEKQQQELMDVLKIPLGKSNF